MAAGEQFATVRGDYNLRGGQRREPGGKRAGEARGGGEGGSGLGPRGSPPHLQTTRTSESVRKIGKLVRALLL